MNAHRLANGSSIHLYMPETAKPQKFVVYFHGGGLVYGSKSDLPKKLAEVFLNKGFGVIALDYLLAPNSGLSDILAALKHTYKEIQDSYIKKAPFIFCGRSAGSYLMFLLTSELLKQQEALPDYLINFYGYTDLSFIQTPRNLNVPLIKEEMLPAFELEDSVWDDPQLQRYLLYLYGVQQNKLTEFYQAESTDFALSAEQLAEFPPIFGSASTADQEVPFRYSKQLAKYHEKSVFVPVYYLEHDFLKQTADNQVSTVFERLSQWLN
ncbi:esterase [Enterococcus florum]|uniref:Esterase n=1 Tax=Enterococcus florum TaxID=2480627 RepID=A0A4P5PEX9_9ENTE|nr:alpha/beta hydrolase [Enterococcus florum]GCF95264.1 esterase [Enterococcus florum]